MFTISRKHIGPSKNVYNTHPPFYFEGAHRPPGFDGGDQSLLPIRRSGEDLEFDNKAVKRASEMESFMVWDGTRRSCILEIASYPTLAAASRDPDFEVQVANAKHTRGKWETLARLGGVLNKATSIKFIICDQHGSHDWVARLLLGQTIEITDELLSKLPFWSELSFEQLPVTCFPLPWRVPMLNVTLLWRIAALKETLGFQMFPRQFV